MKSLIAFVCFFSFQSLAFSSGNKYSGFYAPKGVLDLPLKTDVRNSVFKIVISKGAESFGTAYALKENILLTNVHNITQCLRDYGLVDSGYDGSKGPLICKSLSLIDGQGIELTSVELLASNSRYNNDDKDFAVIKVIGLKATPIILNPYGPQLGAPVFIVGFPSTTFRSPQKLNEKMINLVNIINIVFDVETKINGMRSNSSSQDLFSKWISDGFQKIHPLVKWNEFLSGSLLGREWNPLIKWQFEDSLVYRKNLLNHISHFKNDTYSFIQIIEKSQLKHDSKNLDADNSLKVSKGKVVTMTGNVFLVEGDATPGSSGSLVVDSLGSSVGILFQIRKVGNNENDICLLDAIMTNFESIRFSYCPSLGPTMVSSKTIFETLQTWGIKL